LRGSDRCTTPLDLRFEVGALFRRHFVVCLDLDQRQLGALRQIRLSFDDDLTASGVISSSASTITSVS
jgi:hypothetical protein